MTREKKIEFVLAVYPNLKAILQFATDDQIDRYVNTAKEQLENVTCEMQFNC